MKLYERPRTNRSVGILAGAAALTWLSPALAQQAPATETPPATAEVNAAVSVDASATAEAPEATPAAEAAAPEPPAVEAAPEPPLAQGDPELKVAAAETLAAAEGNGLAFSAFVDAYANWQTGQVGAASAATGHRAYDSNFFGPTGSVNENGFSLAFAGIDARYDGGEVGATTSLRFGPGVTEFFGGDNGPAGIDNLTQAYVTWNPGGGLLTLDFGQFSTIFGAEVTESWKNLNYTRGALYYALQPFWHTGLRANLAFSDQFALNLMVVDSANQISIAQNNGGIAFAAQAAITPSDMFSLYVGGMFDTDESTLIDRFGDIVAVINADALTVVLNADYLAEQDLDTANWGASGAVGYAFSDAFGLAGRLEYLNFDTEPDATTLITATGTIDVKPIQGKQNLIVRWDNRFESSSEDVFADSDGAGTDTWFTTVLGVVATTDL